MTTFSDGNEIFLFDGLTCDASHPHWKSRSQLCMVFFAERMVCWRSSRLVIKGITDCGLFAIDFAYCSAQGDNVTKLEIDQSIMQLYLLDCFQSEELEWFPKTTANPKKQKPKCIFIHYLPNGWKIWHADDRMWRVCQLVPFRCVGSVRGKCPKRSVCRCCCYDTW